jgi:hypothetical protein
MMSGEEPGTNAPRRGQPMVNAVHRHSTDNMKDGNPGTA